MLWPKGMLTEDYIMDDNQVAKPKPGKVAKVNIKFVFLKCAV